MYVAVWEVRFDYLISSSNVNEPNIGPTCLVHNNLRFFGYKLKKKQEKENKQQKKKYVQNACWREGMDL